MGTKTALQLRVKEKTLTPTLTLTQERNDNKSVLHNGNQKATRQKKYAVKALTEAWQQL